ncbi:Dyp-type peroxidase [Rhizobium puerariae]|uniref:Dyp-type peroxidase n=1 Tax=Rhizobium puerariae TaxID=1585791 RepID=A0ABV6AQJ2_9HYPH
MMAAELDLSDIQGTVLRNRPMPYFGSYLVFTISDASAARQLLQRLVPHVTSAADWDNPPEDAWINVVFSFAGLRKLVDRAEDLAGFPAEFRQGMARRNVYLGDVGASDPSNWDLPHGGNGFDIGLLIMAGNLELKEEKLAIGHAALEGLAGVELAARLDVSVPSTMREHFGYVDGISRPFIEGQGGLPLPGQDVVKAGEFILGHENELGGIARLEGPEALWRNGTFIAIRKIRQDVAAFRKFLRDNAEAAGGEEMLAAKMMGRWRSGAPLALSPDGDDAGLAKDPGRNNDFAYNDDDPDGRKTPLGSHIRRVNPRDGLKETLTDIRLHRVLRRGFSYGPELPEDTFDDDGIDRGIVLAIINADPGRQFEFVQAQWINDGDFISQGERTDPIIGRRDRTDDFQFPAKPVRRRVTGLPDFTLVKGGEHVFLPSIPGLRWLSARQG